MTEPIEKIQSIFIPRIMCGGGLKVKLEGWHHDYEGKLQQTDELHKKKIKEHVSGCYEIKWGYKGSEKFSTMFPNDWPREKVLDKISEAAKNIIRVPTFKKGGKMILQGKTRDGIYINIVLKGSELINAYPVI